MPPERMQMIDRKSTRLNSSHVEISYAVFCLKKKIMTATLVLERLPLDRVVKVPPAATRTPLVREGLRRNERVPAWKLFDGLLIFSGNDDAFSFISLTKRIRVPAVAAASA